MSDLDVHLPQIAAGDADAFAAWLRGAEAPLRRSLRSFASAVDTEAVLQEGLLSVWQVAPRVRADGRPNALLRFAQRVVRNAAIDEVRRRRPRPLQADQLEAVLNAEAAVDAPDPPDPLLWEAVRECRRRLPPQPARALTARLEAGPQSDRDLAERIGMKPNTFLKNVGRARALLLACLQAAGISRGALGT